MRPLANSPSAVGSLTLDDSFQDGLPETPITSVATGQFDIGALKRRPIDWERSRTS
jgi:hypothetical protein